MRAEAGADAPAVGAAIEELGGKSLGRRRGGIERARIGAHRGDRLEPAARGAVVERVEDEIGEPVAQGQRQGHDAPRRRPERRRCAARICARWFRSCSAQWCEQLRDREPAVLRVPPVLRLLRRAEAADVGEVRAAQRREGGERLARRRAPVAAAVGPAVLVPRHQRLPRLRRDLADPERERDLRVGQVAQHLGHRPLASRRAGGPPAAAGRDGARARAGPAPGAARPAGGWSRGERAERGTSGRSPREPPSGDVFDAGARDEIVQRPLVGAEGRRCRYPMPRMTAENQEPRWRSTDRPNGSGATVQHDDADAEDHLAEGLARAPSAGTRSSRGSPGSGTRARPRRPGGRRRAPT